MKPPCYGIPKASDSFNESWFSLSATNESHWRLIKSSRLRLGKLPVSERERRLRQDGGGALSCTLHIYIGGEILLQLSKWEFIFNALLSYFPQEKENDEGVTRGSGDKFWLYSRRLAEVGMGPFFIRTQCIEDVVMLFGFFGRETPRSVVICSSRWLLDWRSSSNPVINGFSLLLWISHTHKIQRKLTVKWMTFL